ncbi:MAG: hypothetical protein HOV80_30060 [Polyangiaceae bacterium]|nr:hypothetical protein [Polyangiaceae bacterium]
MTRSIGAALWAAFAILVAGAGCSSEPADQPTGPAATAGQAPSASEASAAQPAETAAADAPELTPIGYAKLPPPISSEATLANLKALQEHQKKQWEKSRAGFEEAVRLAPHYGIARFNLACARSRTGDVAGAATLLEALLDEDMPQYAPRLAADPDLEALRAAPEGEKLRARVEALRPRWKEAAKGGLPSVLWRGTEARSGSPITYFIRPGVYQHGARRFVPLGASSQKLAAAVLDPEHERVLLFGADLSVECMVDFCPRVYGYEIEVGSLFGEPNPGPKRTVAGDGSQMIWGVAAQLTEDGFRYDEAVAGAGGWRRVGKDGAPKVDKERGATAGARLDFEASGSTLTRQEGGYSMKGDELVSSSGERVKLDAMHGKSGTHTVLISPDRSTVFVLSSRSQCVCDTREGSDFDYVLSRVDITSGKPELVSHQDGSAAIAFDADGALYLQEGTRLRRWPKTLPRTAPEPIEEGVLITTPDYGPTNCCGL